jgi:hypothetical protein
MTASVAPYAGRRRPVDISDAKDGARSVLCRARPASPDRMAFSRGFRAVTTGSRGGAGGRVSNIAVRTSKWM